MIRLRRILFKTATALSLLMCIFFAALWVRSYFVPDAVAWRLSHPNNSVEIISIHSYDGRIGIEGIGEWAVPPNLRLGLSWRSGRAFWLPSGWNPQATIPHWHLLIYTGALPIWFCVRHYLSLPALQKRRRKKGLCPTCGYDLRASPDCCPECGAIPSGAVS
jgi:hypothetical protein